MMSENAMTLGHERSIRGSEIVRRVFKCSISELRKLMGGVIYRYSQYIFSDSASAKP